MAFSIIFYSKARGAGGFNMFKRLVLQLVQRPHEVGTFHEGELNGKHSLPQLMQVSRLVLD
jgi:hypothetical protein